MKICESFVEVLAKEGIVEGKEPAGDGGAVRVRSGGCRRVRCKKFVERGAFAEGRAIVGRSCC